MTEVVPTDRSTAAELRASAELNVIAAYFRERGPRASWRPLPALVLEQWQRDGTALKRPPREADLRARWRDHLRDRAAETTDNTDHVLAQLQELHEEFLVDAMADYRNTKRSRVWYNSSGKRVDQYGRILEDGEPDYTAPRYGPDFREARRHTREVAVEYADVFGVELVTPPPPPPPPQVSVYVMTGDGPQSLGERIVEQQKVASILELTESDTQFDDDEEDEVIEGEVVEE